MPKLKKRPDGRFQSKVYLGVFDNMKQYKYVYGKSQKEIDEKVLALKMSLKKGIDIKAQGDTFEEWAEQWLGFKKLEVSYNWFLCICNRVDNLTPLYNIPIAKIKTVDIQRVINAYATIPRGLTKKPYSKKTLNDLKIVAQSIFKLAVDNRVIDYNPASAVKLPNATEAVTKRALTDEERSWITNTPHRAQRAAMIMMLSGLRRGELIPLTWSDIDFESATITVNKSVEMVEGKPIVKHKTKSKAGMRTVFIPQLLVDFLRNEKKTSLLVCPSARGTMMSKSAWRKLWEKYLYDLNLRYGNFSDYVESENSSVNKTSFVIPRFTAHWLRHTYITMLYFAGIDILTAKEQAGHADIKTTMSIYTHLDNEFKIISMQKFDAFLSKNKPHEDEKKPFMGVNMVVN
ncbi:MAG: site-specific integrase [Oscillospiraceae bacterium]|jgi:integrase|nr:site-specific integrase [Oscillospiraceae bacterium]